VVNSEYKVGKKVNQGIYNLEEIRPARAFTIVATIESMILADKPKFFLRGYTAIDEEDVAPIFENALNNEWMHDSSLLRESRLCARDCAKYGIGVMLTSFETDTFPDPDEAKKTRDSLASDATLAAAAAEKKLTEAKQEAILTPEERIETFEADSRIYRETISSRHIPVDSFLFDPDASGPETAKWMGRIIVAELDAVKNDPNLTNTEGLVANVEISMDSNLVKLDDTDTRYRDYEQPYDLIILYELFIRRPGGLWDMVVIPQDQDIILREEKAPYWIGNPYKVLRWNEDGEEFVPQSDIQVVLSEILAERILMNKVFDGYSREHVDTTFYDARAGLSEEELHAAADPLVGKYVKVTGLQPNQNLSTIFWKLSKDAKSPEALNVLSMMERSIQLGVGLGPNQFGQALRSGTSATEAAEVGNFARSRGANKFAAMEEFISAVAGDRIGMTAQFYDTTNVQRTLGDEAAEVWATIEWTRADVQRGLQIIVEPGTTKRQSDELRANQIIQVLGIANQDPVLRSLLNMPEFFKELFKTMGFHEGSKFLLQQDGQEFGEMAARVDAAQILGGQSLRGGSPASSPGLSNAASAQGVAG